MRLDMKLITYCIFFLLLFFQIVMMVEWRNAMRTCRLRTSSTETKFLYCALLTYLHSFLPLFLVFFCCCCCSPFNYGVSNNAGTKQLSVTCTDIYIYIYMILYVCSLQLLFSPTYVCHCSSFVFADDKLFKKKKKLCRHVSHRFPLFVFVLPLPSLGKYMSYMWESGKVGTETK